MSDQIKQALLDALTGPMPARIATPPETVRPDVTLTACGCDNLRDSLRAQLGGGQPVVCREHSATPDSTPAAPVALNDDAALAALALGTTQEN